MGEKKSIIGWKERVSFPNWGVALKALIDPGAPLSTLEVRDIKAAGRVRDKTGRRRLVLQIAVPLAHGDRVKTVYAFYERRSLLSEAGGTTYVVRLPLRLGDFEWEADIALLRSRKRRRHFLHLGREAAAGRFLVDTSRAYMHKLKPSTEKAEPFLPLPGLKP